jgi:hypothetical protein
MPGRNNTNIVDSLESYKVTDAYFRVSRKVGVYKAPIGPKPPYHTIHIESANNVLELPRQLAVLNTGKLYSSHRENCFAKPEICHTACSGL